MPIIMKLMIIDDFQSMPGNNYGCSVDRQNWHNAKLHLKLYLWNDLTFCLNVWVKGKKKLCHITSDCSIYGRSTILLKISLNVFTHFCFWSDAPCLDF